MRPRAFRVLQLGMPLVLAAAIASTQPKAAGAQKQVAAAAVAQARSKLADVPKSQEPDPKLPIGLDQSLYLIRSTLLTLNDANATGNYSVLRDLAAPGLQARYNQADLGRIFADLRDSHVSLSAVALTAPLLSEPPKLEQSGELHLIGRFATQPRQINFDLLYQIVDGHWKWLAMSVTAPDAPASAATGSNN